MPRKTIQDPNGFTGKHGRNISNGCFPSQLLMETAMTGSSTSNSHRCKTLQLILLCVLQIILLWGCGGDTSEPAQSGGLASTSTDTGSASFAVQWHTADPADRAATVVRQAIEDCESAGVASISCEVYDESHNQIASGGPWDCEAHEGRIKEIPAGSNRTLIALGWNSKGGAGDIVFRGQTENNIIINPGAVADAGTINAYSFIPALYAPGNNAQVDPNNVSLEWELLENANEYLVQVAEDAQFNTIIINETTPATTYAPSTLEPSKEYFWKISAIDIHDNIGAESEVRSFVTFEGQGPVISGYIRTSSGTGISGAALSFSNNGGSVTTNGSGYYSNTVPYGWSGTVTPSLNGYSFSPSSNSYENVTADQSNENFTGTPAVTPVISGFIRTSFGTGISGVTLSFSNNGGSVTTNGSGYYSNTVPYGWSGTVTPSLNGYSFSPSSNSYENVTADQSNENFTGTPFSPVISGYIRTTNEIGISGATVSFSNIGSVTTDRSGHYSNTVPYGWSGTVTPSLNEYYFSPSSNSYKNVRANQSNKDFIGTPLPDYTITELSSANVIMSGSPVDVTAAIVNQGGSPTACIAIGYYLSTDATITTSDTRLAHWELKPCNLDPGEKYTWTMSVTIPQNIYYGSFYLGIIVDVDQSETESNENNNTDAQNVYIYY